MQAIILLKNYLSGNYFVEGVKKSRIWISKKFEKKI